MAAITKPRPATGGQAARVRVRSAWLPLGAIILAVLLWAFTLAHTDVSKMSDFGLVSVLPRTWFAAMAVMAVGFAAALRDPETPRRVLTAFPLSLSAMFYLTPPLLYGGVSRYSWTWKHAGIVDYIQTTGTVNRDIGPLEVYHNWPGFFAFNAMMADLAGLHSAMSYAAWAEVFVNVLTVAAVMTLLRCLTDDYRTVAVGGFLFALGNWVGQGYWSPQATSYVWYLLLLVILLRWFPGSPVARRERTDPDGADIGKTVPWRPAPATRVWLMSVVLLLLVCAVSTHQLTPLAIALTTGALVLFRRVDAPVFPLLAAVMMAAWVLYAAAPFMSSNLAGAVSAIGEVDNNVHGSLIGYGNVSTGLLVVSLVARGLALVICALAGLGVLATLRRRGRAWWTGLILASVPVLLAGLSNYGTEILFRAYLFALPGLIFFAAVLLWPPGVTVSRSRPLIVALTSMGLMAAFVFAQYGNDRRYHFTKDEVTAAKFVYGHAPPDALLVEGSRCYPSQFENYANFTNVAIDLEEPAGRDAIVRHPVSMLAAWMSDKKKYSAGYVIITRSQKVETDSTGDLPRGALSAIQRKLENSPRFQVLFRNRDAEIFALANNAPAPQGRRRSPGGTR